VKQPETAESLEITGPRVQEIVEQANRPAEANRIPTADRSSPGPGGWRYRAALLLLFTALWVVLAVNPSHRGDWLLENLLVFAGVPFLAFAGHKGWLSNASFTLLFVFLVFHEIGSHFTYSEVPLDELAGGVLAGGRNHYDRFVHFLFGALAFYPAREIIAKTARPAAGGRFVFPLLLVLSLGACYELLEWLAAAVVAPDAGIAFLGTQGDAFDAQKDLSLNLAGAVLSGIFIFFKKSQQGGHVQN
jgi:putative membrane protein